MSEKYTKVHALAFLENKWLGSFSPKSTKDLDGIYTIVKDDPKFWSECRQWCKRQHKENKIVDIKRYEEH